MKRILLGPTSALLASFALVAPALAVDLVNEDRVRYRVTVVDETGERDYVIGAGESLFEICIQCDIRIEDVGSIAAQPDDVIIIRNRELVVSS